MSTEEQMAAIGKLVYERREARQKASLLAQHIRDTAADLFESGSILKRQDMTTLWEGLRVIEKMIQNGGLERLKKAITDYQSLGTRIAELSQSLSASGAE